MSQTYIICTDGSCLHNPGPGGWAFEVWETEVSGDFPAISGSGSKPATTNNAMELTAMVCALQDLLASGLVPGLVKLRADSEYVLNNMFQNLPLWKAAGWKGSRKKTVANVEKWQELHGLIKSATSLGWHLEPDWVKGHAGNTGNERVDTLAAERAKEAAQDLIEDRDIPVEKTSLAAGPATEEFTSHQIALLRSFIDPYASGDFSAKDVLRALRHNASSLGLA